MLGAAAGDEYCSSAALARCLFGVFGGSKRDGFLDTFLGKLKACFLFFFIF